MVSRPLATALVFAALTLTLGCQKGASVQKNAHGMPVLAPATGGAPKVEPVPANLIPPGATPMKTETGTSSRNYSLKGTAEAASTFFATALPNANMTTKRDGNHITVSGGGWVIEIYGAGEAETAECTIVYLKESEVPVKTGG